MRKPSNFCAALKTVVGLEAVAVEWRRDLGEDWSWARELLTPTGSLAGCYPKIEANSESMVPYRVVCHNEDADDYVGVCPDDVAIRLSRAELTVLALDRAALAARLATSLGLVLDFAQFDDLPATFRVGSHTMPGRAASCVYFAVPSTADELLILLSRLSVKHAAPYLVVTPTRSCWQAWPEGLAERGARVVALELFSVDSNGNLTPPMDMSELLSHRSDQQKPDKRADGWHAPRTVIYLGEVHTCDLTKPQIVFVNHALSKSEISVHALMHPKKGLLFKEPYVNVTAKRNKISKFLSRLSGRLLNASPPLRMGFSLPRHSEFVICDDHGALP